MKDHSAFVLIVVYGIVIIVVVIIVIVFCGIVQLRLMEIVDLKNDSKEIGEFFTKIEESIADQQMV